MTEHIHILEIIDSRGNPTLKALYTHTRPALSAAVPSGASTGKHEAVELRDGEDAWNGKGVSHAAGNARALAQQLSWESADFVQADENMLAIDGTPNKQRMGANALLALSMLQARVQAHQQEIPLYELLSRHTHTTPAIPLPFANVLNGGRHAGNPLAFQEFMVVPIQATSFAHATQIVAEVTHALKKRITDAYGSSQTGVGDEGGFAPDIKDPHEACTLLLNAASDAGHTVAIAMDPAASEFFEDGVYVLSEQEKLAPEAFVEYYVSLLKQFPIISLEDPFNEDDFTSFAALKARIKEEGLHCQIVGDDLTVTNPVRIQQAIKENSADCLLLKINQIGTITQALSAARLAMDSRWNVMVSHRSGETEDTFIADLAVALGCGQIKLGAPVRGERTAKYNRLIELEATTDVQLRNDFLVK